MTTVASIVSECLFEYFLDVFRSNDKRIEPFNRHDVERKTETITKTKKTRVGKIHLLF